MAAEGRDGAAESTSVMEVWELVARESIRDRIARWNSNGDAGRMAEMVKVLAPDVEFSVREGEVMHGRDAVLESLLGVKDGKADRVDAPAPTGRYLPPGKRPSIRHFTSNPQIDFESETLARVRTYYQVLSTVRSRPLGSLPRRVRRGRRRVAHHQAHRHHRGRRSRGLGRGAGVSDVAAPPAITSTTLGDLFEEIGTREPDALAYVDGDERLTYGEWLAGADSLAAEFARGECNPVRSWPSRCRRASTTRSRTPRARASGRSRPASTPPRSGGDHRDPAAV